MGHGAGDAERDGLTPAPGGTAPAAAETELARNWRGLLFTAAGAAFGSVVLIVAQVILFTIWAPVESAGAVFDLMEHTPVMGLISLDALLLINNLLVMLIYLGLAPVLWNVSRSGVVLGVGLGLVQVSAYVASNPAVEMLSLAARWAGATVEQQDMLLVAGDGVLSAWRGTAFLVWYWLGATVLFILAWMLLRSALFPRGAGWWALTVAVLMLVPPTFGIVGIAFSLVSVVPWCAMCLLVGWRLLHLGRELEPAAQPVPTERTSPPGHPVG